MIYCCPVWSTSLFFVVPFCGGSALVCQTGHFELRSAEVHCQQCSSSAQCPRGQYWVRVCLYFTQPTSKHEVNLHACADDTQLSQLYIHCRRGDTSTGVVRLEGCITEVEHWMSANCLKLNADKTELVLAGSKYGLVPLAVIDRHYSLKPTQSQRASTLVCSASRHRPTSVWTSTSLL